MFDISVSAESLRLLFNDCKQHTATPENDGAQIPKRVIQELGELLLDPCDDDDENHHEVGEEYVQPTSQLPLDEDNRKHVVVSVKTEEHEGYQFCHHAGVLMFSLFLNQLDTRLGACSAWIKQWIVTILLGAANIEQSKLLNTGALKLLFGEVNMNMCQQRRNLAALAMTDCLEKMVSLNGEWAGLSQSHDFYYDPHSKHYTGGEPLLKGWCTRLRFAEKVLHMDFIHTVSGFPVYILHDDNFYDLRERFLPAL